MIIVSFPQCYKWPGFHDRFKLCYLEQQSSHLAPAALVVPVPSPFLLLAQVLVEPCGDLDQGRAWAGTNRLLC